jgi:hypothetical protein
MMPHLADTSKRTIHAHGVDTWTRGALAEDLVCLPARPEAFALPPPAGVSPTELEVLLHQNTPLKRGAGPPEQPTRQYAVDQYGGVEPLSGGNTWI